MDLPGIDIHSRFVNPRRMQRFSKSQDVVVSLMPCPFGHQGRFFQNIEQLVAHATREHLCELDGLDERQAKVMVREKVIQARQLGSSLEPTAERQSSPSRKKRRAESEIEALNVKTLTHNEIADPNHSTGVPGMEQSRTRLQDARLYNYRQCNRGNSPRRSLTETKDASSRVPSPTNSRKAGHPTNTRQPGLIELQKYDPRYPGLLLQPDTRPISQEQLASEVKSIYAGLTMVETKCVHVDRAQAAALEDLQGGKLAPDHWQALIALHRTLLHEHHDFFLASQHPSASPALRRLAAEYKMPARMWKHGIHSFLELLRQTLPESLDYMLAFIDLAYQMMALLHETVPAFEDTWIECLGDLGRYRMAIEDEEIRDRETWANVARSWYSKAADKDPVISRLYHHLAILARTNGLQQLYYYRRSLHSVELFPTVQEAVRTLFRSPLADKPLWSSAPIDPLFTVSHALGFTRLQKIDYERTDFLLSLDNHIGQVTAKWKEQGDYIAVTNIAGLFDYGGDTNVLRQLFLLRALQRKTSCSEVPGFSGHDDKPADVLTKDSAFAQVQRLPHVSHLFYDTPWTELTSFLNTLIKKGKSAKFRIFEEDVSEPSNDSVGREFFVAADFLSWCSPWEGFAWKILDSAYSFTRARLCKFARAMAGIGSRKMMVLVMASLPKAFAYGPASSPATLLRKTVVFDYVLYSLMLPSMGLLWWLGPKTSEPSFIVKLLFSFFWFAATNTSSLFDIRTTIIQIWAVFAFNYIARDCAQAIEPGLHLVKYLVLSALFISLGSSIQTTQDDKVLKVTPIALAVAAVVLYFIPKRTEVTSNQTRRQQDLEIGLPDPAVFDLESLRSESTGLAEPTTRPTSQCV